MLHPVAFTETGEEINIEVIQVQYDETQISYEMLLNIFFTGHDPTTLDRQWKHTGKDVWSWVFIHNEDQKQMIVEMFESLTEEHIFDDKIVTQIAAAGVFISAEPHHHKYYTRNPEDVDCINIISPKIDILRKRRERYLKVGLKK